LTGGLPRLQNRCAKAALKKQLAAGTIGLADRQRRDLISLLHR
jgi:hypothetical protein